ncbi:MAG: hypothetical protein QOG76_8339, partial [Pseudonocardiales bacterium]|nr:hypothetical protein [Pseudonocardiales bacterium]
MRAVTRGTPPPCEVAEPGSPGCTGADALHRSGADL